MSVATPDSPAWVNPDGSTNHEAIASEWNVDSGELSYLAASVSELRDLHRKHTIAKRVELGIRYLSNAYGGVTGLDWLSKMVGPIEMGNNTACVLSYVTGDFATSPLVTMFGFKQASEWGFYLTANDLDEGLTYDMLTEAWERRLTDLKSKRADALLARANAGLDDSWYEEA